MQVQHDVELRFMRFQWREPARHPLRAAQAGRSLRPALVYGRDLVVTQQPTHALIDYEGLPPICLADELWMTVNFLPQVATQALEQVALIFRPEHLHNQMMVESVLWAGRHLLRFQVQVFEDVPVALDWLTPGNAAAARRLQAEWDALPAVEPG